MLLENFKNTKYIFVDYIRCTFLFGTNVGFEKDVCASVTINKLSVI
jgi:hypothetical protein